MKITAEERDWASHLPTRPAEFECECSFFPDRLPWLDLNIICCFHDWAYHIMDANLEPKSPEWRAWRLKADRVIRWEIYLAAKPVYGENLAYILAQSMYLAVRVFGRLGKRLD